MFRGGMGKRTLGVVYEMQGMAESGLEKMERQLDREMNRLVEALLYEGYILYPYRVSAPKNRSRFTFGRVYPEAYSLARNGSEPCQLQMECLLQGDKPGIDLKVRFLQPRWREVIVDGAVVDHLDLPGTLLQTWQEAIEREITLPETGIWELNGATRTRTFAFEGAVVNGESFPLCNPQFPGTANSLGAIRRRHDSIAGEIQLSAMKLSDRLWKISVIVGNRSGLAESSLNDPDAVLMRTFASTHVLLHVREGCCLSLTEAPPEYAEAASQCDNIGVWPVLIGDESSPAPNWMLASPIILYDYPKIAPESIQDQFDGTEIDELLALRILAMPDSEKSEIRQADERARRILDRIESLQPEQLLRMHGVRRDAGSPGEDQSQRKIGLQGAMVGGRYLPVGSRVRIRPCQGGDAMDLMLVGRAAVIESVEQDFEGRIYFALILEDDPGKDLGFARKPGHRFFYSSEDLEAM